MARILIVDDSVTIRQILAFTLQNGGFAVEEAGSVDEALARLLAARFDLVFADAYMPGEGGIELVRRVRATAGLAAIPVVMLGTEHDRPLKEESRNAGATGWVPKPFGLGTILDLARYLLERPRASPADRAKP